uniref:Integrase catalytic domain-containing protein n=1 Tax=Anopheles minimus TaxID=112268 RepID=A0A182W3N8_9DIPT
MAPLPVQRLTPHLRPFSLTGVDYIGPFDVTRFIGRRGWPVKFLSYNGTNFKGASKEIAETVEIIHNEYADILTNARTKWSFNPPVTPHMGGAWERLMRSVKGVLAAINDGRRLMDEILLTAIVDAEDIINNRPLVTVTQEGSNRESLTPNHFLRSFSETDVRAFPKTNVKEALRDSYRRSRQLAEEMWSRWVKEYAPT